MNLTDTPPVGNSTVIVDDVTDDYDYYAYWEAYWDWIFALPSVAFFDKLQVYAIPFIIAVGIPGNILTLIVLFSKKYGWFPSNISLVCLALADTLVLVHNMM